MLPPLPLTDPDVQISRFRFFTERFARAGNDTIRDSSAKEHSDIPCQVSYPLPFRGQACGAQSLLPVSRQRFSPRGTPLSSIGSQ